MSIQLRPLSLPFFALALAAFSLGNASNDSNGNVLVRASSQLASFTLSSRLMSMSTGKPQCVRAVGPFSLISYKPHSPALEKLRPKMPKGIEIDFPLGVSMVDSDWSVCFGVETEESESLRVRLMGPDGDLRQVEIGIDGSVMVSDATLSG